ncbi:MAG: hypothetical protein G8345_05880 [Magnetococcales bacterium]|nr:hypothetical protein [Magnetococcales bacterium]NGZ26398.1 hypothetical protein [Magnetococcales bacterium]
MSLFWIVGIVINVILTALAVWWIVRHMKDEPETSPNESDNSKDGS